MRIFFKSKHNIEKWIQLNCFRIIVLLLKLENRIVVSTLFLRDFFICLFISLILKIAVFKQDHIDIFLIFNYL